MNITIVQAYLLDPFWIPSKTTETWSFFLQFSGKDEFLAKRRSFYEICQYAQKTIFSSKYCKFVDFWFGWYVYTYKYNTRLDTVSFTCMYLRYMIHYNIYIYQRYIHVNDTVSSLVYMYTHYYTHRYYMHSRFQRRYWHALWNASCKRNLHLSMESGDTVVFSTGPA